jgi:hypothetical protein
VIPSQTIEELLSISCVSAIIARSGHAPNPIAHDFGVDLEVRRIATDGNKRIDVGAFLSLQLKASVVWVLEQDHVVFDLEADAYNRLVFQNEQATIPCALILCCLPPDSSRWLSACEDDLIFRKCCYYHFLKGRKTSNTSSKRIRIPRDQILTPESILKLRDSLFAGALS